MALHPAFWPLETPRDSGSEHGRYRRTFGLWRGRTDWVNPLSANPASTGPAVPQADDDEPVAASWIADGIDIAGRNLASVFTAELEVAAETADAAAFLALVDLLRALPRLATEAAAHEEGTRTARILEELSGRLRAAWVPWTDTAARLGHDPAPAPAAGALPVDRLRDLAARDVLAFTTCLAYLTPTGLPDRADVVAAAGRRMLGDAWPAPGEAAAGRPASGPSPAGPAPWTDLNRELAGLLAPLPHREWCASHNEVREFADLLAGFLVELAGRTAAPAADSSSA